MALAHRDVIRSYLEALVYHRKLIYDWGSGSKPVFRYIQHDNCKFVTFDKNGLIASDRRADEHYTHDITDPVVLKPADIAFCMEVLEHTTEPKKILANIYDNLKPGGVLHMSVPFMFPQHSDDDYFRYTQNGLEYLLKEAGFGISMIMSTVEEQGFIVKAFR